MNYDFTNGFSVVIMFLSTTCFKISLRLLETFLFDVEHCCVPESNLLSGSLTYFPEFYPVCAEFPTVDQFVSNCKLILFLEGSIFLCTLYPYCFWGVEFCVIDLVV